MCMYNMLKCALGNGDDQRVINQILYSRGVYNLIEKRGKTLTV